jgi:hypothetical protein
MLEGYKIMRALSELGDGPFTVEDIMARSGVSKPGTVRTVLAREGHLVEEVGRQKTGQRGAQPKRYQLSTEALPALNERLAAIEAVAAPQPQDRNGDSPLPSGLLAAEETLLALGDRDLGRLEHEASIGWLGFDAGRRAQEAHPEGECGELDAHLAVVEALISLIELEQTKANGRPIDDEQIEVTRRLFERVEALELEPDLETALDARLEKSPIGDRLAPVLVDVMFTGAAEHEVEQVVRLLTDQELFVRRTDFVSVPPRRRAQFGVLVLGGEGEREELRLERFGNEPVIVVDAFGNWPEAERLSARRQSTVYLSGLPQLVTAISFVRGVGDSWLPVGQRLLGR